LHQEINKEIKSEKKNLEDCSIFKVFQKYQKEEELEVSSFKN